MSAIDRIPSWKVRRMTRKQRAAYDQLSYGSPSPAERAYLKQTLGMRRTRAEMIAASAELLEQGMTRMEAAARLDVTADYLDRLATAGNDLKNTAVCREFSGLSDTTQVVGHPRPAPPLPPGYVAAPIGGFRSFADLDRFLEETGR